MQTPKPIPISDILDEIARGTSLDQSLNLVAQKARADLHAPSCKIWVVKHGDICQQCPLAQVCTNREMCLHLAAVSGSAPEKEFPRIPISLLNTALIARGGIADFNDPNPADEKLFAAQLEDYPDSDNSYALYPLRGLSGTVGLIGVFNNRAIEKNDLLALAQLSPAAVAAIRVAELQARCEGLRQQLEQGAPSSADAQPSQELLLRIQEQHETLLKKLDETEQQANWLEAQVEARQQDLAGMQVTIQQWEEKLDQLEAYNHELRDYNTALVEKIELLEDELRRAEEAAMNRPSEAKEFAGANGSAHADELLHDAPSQTAEEEQRLNEEIERLHRELTRLQKENDKLTRENLELAQVNEELNAGSQITEARLLDAERENRELKDAKTQLEEALKQLEALVPKLEESVEQLSSRIEANDHFSSELEQRNRALAEESKRLADKARVNARLIAQLSHELRHPVSSIVGFTSLLLDDPALPLVDKQRHNLERIARNASDLSEFINQILDYSKIEAGRMEVFAEPVELSEVIEKAIAVAEGLKGTRPITLQTELADNLPSLRTDKTKLQQILVNLLTNAVKFTEQGEVRILASMADDTHLRLTVADTGIGIPEADLPNIFAEFSQVKRAHRADQSGSGLGLAITQRLTHLLKGDIEVFSKVGEGSMFIVTLPICIESSDAALTETETPPLDSERTALLVSRDAATTYLMKKYLLEADYSVAVTDDLARGLDIVSMAKPAIILLDLEATENAASAVSQMANRRETGRIIAFSMERSLETQAIQNGADRFLTKPVEREVLMAAIEDESASAANYILVVDDDADTVEIVTAMLESRGYAVKTATHGREAMALLKQQAPQAMILDLGLPEMDGFEVAHHLRLHPLWRDLPLVLLTARDLSNEERAALHHDARHLVQKGSFTRDDLLNELDKAIRESQTMKQ